MAETKPILVPDEDHRELKAEAAKQGLTIQQAASEAIKLWLEANRQQRMHQQQLA